MKKLSMALLVLVSGAAFGAVKLPEFLKAGTTHENFDGTATFVDPEIKYQGEWLLLYAANSGKAAELFCQKAGFRKLREAVSHTIPSSRGAFSYEMDRAERLGGIRTVFGSITCTNSIN